MVMHQYQVVGRGNPKDVHDKPTLFRMNLFAPTKVTAKSRFWYYLSRMKKIRRCHGEVISVNEVYEKKPEQVKTYGIWLRYDSRTGSHNMFREYRDCKLSSAVDRCYQDMSARHRCPFSRIQIIRTAVIPPNKAKRAGVQEYLKADIKFPVLHKVPRAPEKKFRTTFKANRPHTVTA